jgi:hypothetical protein
MRVTQGEGFGKKKLLKEKRCFNGKNILNFIAINIETNQ